MKKNWSPCRTVFVLVVSIALQGCGSGSSGPNDSNLPEESSEVTYSVPATTKQISAKDEASVLAVQDDGATIVFDSDSALGANVTQGDVLMFGITSQTPNGLLRKVTSKSNSIQGVVVLTETATIPDSFEELDLKLVRSLPYDEMDSYDTSLQGLEIHRYPLTLEGDVGGKFEVGFDGTVLYDEDGNKNTTDDQVVADGSISFSVGVTLEAKVEWFSLKRLKVGAAVSQAGNLTIKTTLAGLQFKEEVVLGKMYFAPFMVGPVVVTPKLELVLGATGDLNVQVVTSVSEEIAAQAGAVYEYGNWTPYSNITSDWDFQPPTLTASAQVKAYVGPRFSLMLYGVAGPHAQVVAYLDLSADIGKTPWWELHAGIEGSLGIEGEILGHELFKFQFPGIVDFRKLLAQAEGPVGCNPDCSGLECGPDPVCGESCGGCGAGESCQAGQCVEGPCEPNCSGLECGPDPVCGESCGTCGAGEVCQAGGCVGERKPASCTEAKLCDNGEVALNGSSPSNGNSLSSGGWSANGGGAESIEYSNGKAHSESLSMKTYGNNGAGMHYLLAETPSSFSARVWYLGNTAKADTFSVVSPQGKIQILTGGFCGFDVPFAYSRSDPSGDSVSGEAIPGAPAYEANIWYHFQIEVEGKSGKVTVSDGNTTGSTSFVLGSQMSYEEVRTTVDCCGGCNHAAYWDDFVMDW